MSLGTNFQRHMSQSFEKSVGEFFKSHQDGFGEGSDHILKGVLSFDSALGAYRKLVEQQSSSVERNWILSFRKDEFESAGVAKWMPKIYRGLPRLYHKKKPGVSKIKDHFQDLRDLRRCCVERVVWGMYPKPESGSVVFLGWGDTEKAMGRILQEELPQLKVDSISDIGNPDMNILENADVVIDCSSLSNEWDLPKLGPSWIEIGPYGYAESGGFHPQSGRICMGLHVLEKGVLTRKMGSASFSEIENKTLLMLLFRTINAGPMEVERYRLRHRFHLAYLTTPLGGAIFLNSLLKRWEMDGKDIDLCTPDVGWLIRWIVEQGSGGKPSLLGNLGVQRLEIHFDSSERHLPIQKTGKIVRILCPGSLSLNDMRKLMVLSEDWVAVGRGISFTDAISAGKPFFFDDEEDGIYFYKDLLAMAENRLLQNGPALRAIRLMGRHLLKQRTEPSGDWVEELYFQTSDQRTWKELSFEIGSSLQGNEALAGFKKLCRVIREERAFNESFVRLVCRELSHRRAPQLKDLENTLLYQYSNSEISLSLLVKNLAAGMIPNERSQGGVARAP